MSSNYACPCLNVFIRPNHPPTHPFPSITDPDYHPVYVGQDGISIVHPQLTFRSRTHSKPQSTQEPFLRRYTSLSCLICRLSVYRVLQFIPPDLDAAEGPLLPTEEWVEQEILQSGSGWIELTKQCLTDESVALLQSSDAYSPVFRVVLPASTLPLPSPPPPASPPSSPKPPQSVPPHQVLHLSPLFPPPPFVPSHPTFDHLMAVALQQSDQLRKNAQDHISQVVQARVSEIEKEEAELRRQVQSLWMAFREAESALAHEKKLPSPSKQPTTGVTSPPSHASQGSQHVSPLAINDFVPVSTVRPSSPPRDLLPSALSTSLAISSFHHPKASDEGRHSVSPTAATPSSIIPPTSPTLVGSVNYRDPVRRDMNEAKDLATSFKYVVDMEAERSTHARQYQSLSNIKPPQVNTKLTVDAKPAVSGVSAENSDPMPGPSTPKNKVSGEPLSPSGSKGRRKVTFDIKPIVSTGEEKTRVVEEPGEASIFELEDDDPDASQRDTPNGLTLPLRDPIDSPTRPHRQPRVSSGPALPHSLQALRPASLPATVALRASNSPKPEPASPEKVTPSLAAEDTVSVDEPLTPHDQELARLVNVATPSHRNAWTGQSWKLFFGSNDAGVAAPDSYDDETDISVIPHGAASNGNALLTSGISASLPISIAVVPRHRVENGPAEQPGSKPEASTSTSHRKASHAAHDRIHSLDPGAMHLEADGDDESNDDGDGDGDGDGGTLSRGRRRALKILQARSELPDEGMWRSLAT